MNYSFAGKAHSEEKTVACEDEYRRVAILLFEFSSALEQKHRIAQLALGSRLSPSRSLPVPAVAAGLRALFCSYDIGVHLISDNPATHVQGPS